MGDVPKKVPAERMEVTRDCWEEVRKKPVGWATVSELGWPK